LDFVVAVAVAVAGLIIADDDDREYEYEDTVRNDVKKGRRQPISLFVLCLLRSDYYADGREGSPL
jgi:hypothetical protein